MLNVPPVLVVITVVKLVLHTDLTLQLVTVLPDIMKSMKFVNLVVIDVLLVPNLIVTVPNVPQTESIFHIVTVQPDIMIT
jgi:hypothetical protein